MFFSLSINLLAQISPGDLVKAHADLEGMSNCTQCHVLGKQVNQVKCLNCHKELRDIISLKRGYHSNREVTSKKCWNCHGEHFGRNFEIIRFDEEKFDHNKTGYELIGSHKKVDCEKCHNSDFVVSEKLKAKNKTFLGLNKKCITCHEDIHQGTLNDDCSSCHTINKFVPADKFDHNNAKYILTGKHKEVDCEKCHKIEEKGNIKFQKFTGLKYNNCNSCHNDEHNGNFGKDCKSCHNTKSFLKVSMAKSFNHSRTNFPLVGKHNRVKCKSCHKNSISYKPRYEQCLDCHEDYHKGEFTSANGVKDCEECHNEKGFSPSLFTLAKHKESNFELTGAHRATACINCHLVNDEWKFRISAETCISCHENVHGKSIDEKYFDENKCETCHTTATWLDVAFEHNQTEFELLGAHKKTQCSSCHFTKSNLGDKSKYFISVNSNCSSCHDDIHRGQFIEGTSELCNKCHTNINWEPTLFEHNDTKFKIDGAHKNVECSECHKSIKDKIGSYVQYKIEDDRCISCHS